VLVHVSNQRVEAFLGDLQDTDIEPEKITLLPWGVMVLHPPAGEAPEQVTEVGTRAPLEIFLGGLQSIGSWKGFLGYAAAAGVVVWIGLFTNTIYLLTAAMLIAPFASPAMNLALGTARGDATLIWRSCARYFAALAVAIVTAFVLSLIVQQDIATEQMVAASKISPVAVLLPLVAGAAGALNLCQSERNSLVSGAATGMLVAASLSPPAGLIGMAGAMGNWSMVQGGLFVLLLQLVGINVAGAIVFRLFSLTPSGVRYDRGRGWISWTAWMSSTVALALLLTWQLWDRPELQRSSREQRAASEVQRIVNASGIAELAEANVRFTRAEIEGQNTLLTVVYVQAREQTALEEAQIAESLREQLQSRLREEFDVTPLVDVIVLRKK
jgi:uncharacterized hydrophobic protein (TIGR00271 family)